MGQYYRPTLVDKDGEYKTFTCQTNNFRETEDFKHYNGIKLTEHSFSGNSFTDAFSNMIYKNPQRVAWVGDYADDEDGSAFEKAYNFSPRFFENVYGPDSPEPLDVNECEHFDYKGKYLVNHTQKVYIPLDEYCYDQNKWTMYPISLLCAVGNGLGGGDYRGNDEDLVGRYAFDELSIEDEAPEGVYIEDIHPNFYEHWMEAENKISGMSL